MCAMQKNTKPCYYAEYLQLDKFLDSQHPVSGEYQDKEAHDEMLFIVVHQAYELWFKQIIHELTPILNAFNNPVLDTKEYGRIIQRLDRVNQIQKLLNQQIGILETMTPLDFLDFRDYLVPASGFQSIQFKEIEILLGLKMEQRVNFDKKSFYNRLNDEDREHLMAMEQEPTLFDQFEAWLERMPFLENENFSFLEAYKKAVEVMLNNDLEIVNSIDYLTEDDRAFQVKDLDRTREQFNALFDKDIFDSLAEKGSFRMSQKSLLGAVFIDLYRDEPAFQQPYQIIEKLINIDEEFTQWRYRHTIMVHRMLGSKIGTGGSSGHDYLRQTTQNNRFFKDLFNLSTFLIPRSALPELPAEMKEAMGFKSE
jgi:tryptophan 2,3-dioxygenase